MTSKNNSIEIVSMLLFFSSMHKFLIINHVLKGMIITMKSESLKKLQKDLEKMLDGEKIPKYVAENILKAIPKDYNRNDEHEQYTYMNRLYSFGEYKSTLLLYDKKYESRLVQKGVKEELLFSYRPIEPGLLKEHRIRNKRGLFENVTEETKPSKITDKQSNIFLIKKTSWDSNTYDGYKYDYIIYAYKENMKFVNNKQAESNAILNDLRKQLNIKTINESEGDLSES